MQADKVAGAWRNRFSRTFLDASLAGARRRRRRGCSRLPALMLCSAIKGCAWSLLLFHRFQLLYFTLLYLACATLFFFPPLYSTNCNFILHFGLCYNLLCAFFISLVTFLAFSSSSLHSSSFSSHFSPFPKWRLKIRTPMLYLYSPVGCTYFISCQKPRVLIAHSGHLAKRVSLNEGR